MLDVTTNAIESAPVAADRPSYPVLLFGGMKFGYRQQNTFQVEELVSHGYVVAAIDQPYAAATVVFPDGRQAAYDPRWDPPHSAFMDAHIPYLAQDAVFTLDQLVALNRADPAMRSIGRRIESFRLTTVTSATTRSAAARWGSGRPGLVTVHMPMDDVDDTGFWRQIWDDGLDGTPLCYRPFLERKPERCVATLAAGDVEAQLRAAGLGDRRLGAVRDRLPEPPPLAAATP